jgi:hypothetical protein
MAFAGIFTISIAAAVRMYLDNLNTSMFCVYIGFGCGLMFAGALLWIRNKNILKDEVKLKESRLTNSDERIQEISNRAFRASALILIFAMYCIALIGGFFYPVLVQVLLFLVSVFLLAYTISYRVYNKKM